MGNSRCLTRWVVLVAMTLWVSAAAAGDDPFAPPGTERVKVLIESREQYRQVLSLGLYPEERDRDGVFFRVTGEQRDALESLGFVVLVDDSWQKRDDPTLFTSYPQMVAELQQMVSDHPSLTDLASYGQSVQGREIWCLKVTANPGVEEAEPEVRICGAHHGNEQMSVELNLRLAHYLLDNYGSDPDITYLVDNREIWIIPMVNPDGVEADSRYNAHGVDLNRNYGYMWENGGAGPFTEPETRAIRDHATENWFTLSLSFHTSGDYVNSVWNYSPIYTEDDDVVWELTTGYAVFNGYTPIRGWYWYETHGDCNDFSYGARGDIDWTIETDNFNENNVWNLNRDAMLYIIDAAGMGIHGVVTDAVTGDPLRASVWVEGNGWPAFTDPAVGDYHKPLLGGTYDLRFTANGYEDLVIPNVTVPGGGGAVTVDAQLSPGGGHYADRVEMANVADPNDAHQNPTLTMSMLAAPDDVGCSLGRGGDAVLDLGPGSVVTDQAGDDIQVFESSEDASADGYSLYAGDSYMGPWTYVGQATGTASFDLDGSGISSARYLLIQDDGDGSSNATYAGFDLDAIEVFGVSTSTPPWVAGRDVLQFPPPYPNPLSQPQPLALHYELPAAARVTLEVLDASGRRVALLSRGLSPAGRHTLAWDGRDAKGRPVASGAYYLRLEACGDVVTRSIMMIR